MKANKAKADIKGYSNKIKMFLFYYCKQTVEWWILRSVYVYQQILDDKCASLREKAHHLIDTGKITRKVCQLSRYIWKFIAFLTHVSKYFKSTYLNY